MIAAAIRMSIQFMADSLLRRGHSWQCGGNFFPSQHPMVNAKTAQNHPSMAKALIF